MAKLNPGVTLQIETRPCKVKDKNAFFHRWSDISRVISPSVMVGGHPGGVVSKTVGIIEYVEDGTVHECYPDEIRFLDTKGIAMGFYWGDVAEIEGE